MKILTIIALTSMLLISASCDRAIDFNGNWYIGDHTTQDLMDKEGHIIRCDDPRFDKYACLHEDDIKELRRILREAKLPKKVKEKALEFLDMTEK